MTLKNGLLVIALVCLLATAVAMHFLGGIDQEQLQTTLNQAGIWAPVIYIALYTVSTILVLPSTVLNLAGGYIFGPWMGTLWTSIGAIVAAVVAFAFTRTIGRAMIAKRLAGHWQAIDAEIRQGGLFYMFSIRMLPIIPYGLVNFAAGLTSISFKDYFVGTTLGTVPGVLPFVMLGSSGKDLQSGNVLPLLGSLTLIGVLVGGATWYRRHRRDPRQALQQEEQNHD